MTLRTILAIFQAIPKLKDLFEALVAEYVAAQIQSMKTEQRAAIKKAIDEQDQRDLEKAIKSPRAGAPSGIAGAVIVDDLPGVVQNKPRGN